MKKILLMGLSFVLIGCKPRNHWKEYLDPTEGKIGRYQLMSSGENLYRIDTQTGRTWTLEPGSMNYNTPFWHSQIEENSVQVINAMESTNKK